MILNVAIKSIMLSFIMMTIDMLNVVMLNVLAPMSLLVKSHACFPIYEVLRSIDHHHILNLDKNASPSLNFFRKLTWQQFKGCIGTF